MAKWRRRDKKRRSDEHDSHGDAPEPRAEPPRHDEDDLDARLDAVSSLYSRPPTPEELRAAFGRKRVAEKPAPRREDFASSYPMDSLFMPTVDDPVEMPSELDDRSRGRGDYYYDPDDAWAVLGLAPGASWGDITTAHRTLAKVHHPDRLLEATHEERAASETVMRDINVAYSVLRRLTGN